MGSRVCFDIDVSGITQFAINITAEADCVSDFLLQGASGVDVQGAIYSVSFVEGTCVGVFSGCDSSSDFTFPSQAGAQAASQALLDEVFINGPDGAFDDFPDLTFGCTNSPSVCFGYTPYDRGSTVSLCAAVNSSLESSDDNACGTVPVSFTTDNHPTVWAVWTLEPSDPADSIAELVVDVINLNLQKGIANSLDAKLDSAFDSLEDVNENNDVAAVNKLQAFINAVEAQRGKKLTDADADALAGAAQAIIDLLAGG